MRKALIIVALLLAVAFIGGKLIAQALMPAPGQAIAADPEQVHKGEAFLDLLDAGHYEDALAMTTPRVREALADGKLQQVWEKLPKQLGERASRSPLRGESVGGTAMVVSTLKYSMLSLDARIVFADDGLIDGFRIVPAAAAAPAPAAPVASDTFSEREFSVGEPERALPGTLTLPKGEGPFPAVILVHGSGPHDRNESIGPNAPFRDIAHGLAERGIASLRYEKRTKARPEDFASMDFTVDEETVDDAVAAVAALRSMKDIKPDAVFIAGHSLGALMAPRIGQRAPEAAGLILLAAPARPLQDIVLEQFEYLAAADGQLSTEEREHLDAEHAKAAKIATLATNSRAEDNLLGLPSHYWLDLNAYDPVAVAKSIPQPLLILQGGRDYQVTAKGDFPIWQEAFFGEPRAAMNLYPALNHLFIAGEGASTGAEYMQAGNVDEHVIADIAQWIKAAHETH
ncbi:MAG: alpha/beta fold hydrolase [Lysobacteraceae bacterium]